MALIFNVNAVVILMLKSIRGRYTLEYTGNIVIILWQMYVGKRFILKFTFETDNLITFSVLVFFISFMFTFVFKNLVLESKHLALVNLWNWKLVIQRRCQDSSKYLR